MKQKKQKKESIKSKINVLTIILGLGVLGFFYLSYILINDGLNEQYPQIFTLGLGVFFGIFGILCIYSIFTYDDVYIPKTVKPNSSYLSKINAKKIIAAVLILIGSSLLYISFKLYFEKEQPFENTDLTKLTDVITNEVKLNTGSKGSKSILLNLKKYPEFKFQIIGNGFQSMNIDNFLNNVKQGDTISLSIMTDDFNKKITKEKELTFYDKSVNYSFIYVLGVSDKNQNYLNIYDYNEESENDRPWGIGLYSLVGLFLIGSAIFLLKLR
ncbi:MAG: hypothetical protein ACOVO9_08875 [Bacteroidia bacterium]